MSKQLTDPFNLLTRHLSEVIGIDEIKEKLKTKKTLNIYWGTAPTNAPHLAYFLPLIKIRDFIQSGRVFITILLADVHSYLDEGFDSISLVEQRTNYYEFVIKEMLKSLGINDSMYEIRRGSSYQFSLAYIRDLLEFTTLISVNQAKRAGTDVVKSKKDPSLASLLYPLMQCIDEIQLDADIQLGGSDQRKIFSLSRDYSVRRGREKCAYFINPLIPALGKKGKMSASGEAGKISLTESDEVIKAKIMKAWCVETVSDISTDPVLALTKFLIFPTRESVTIERQEKWGGNVTFNCFEDLEQDWIDGKLSGVDLKQNLVKWVCDLIAPVRNALQANPELFEIAYPKN